MIDDDPDMFRQRRMTDLVARRARFREWHATGCFLLPNPWDIGGAKRLERMGWHKLA